MIKEHLSLIEILDINKFQKLQDSLSISTDMALLTVDYKGIPVTKHSSCSQFCTKIRRIPQYQNLCQQCDARGGLEAARIQKPYIYICHMGLVDLAVPIISGNQYVGAVLAGQVRIENAEELEHIKQFNHDEAKCKSNDEIVQDYYSLPLMGFEKIQAIGDVLFDISRVLVERASLAKKLEINEESEKLMATMSEEVFELQNKFLVNNHHLVHIKLPTRYSFLKPSIDYLHEHLGERLYVKELASLCNISESYFSKCFRKATGMSFTTYQSKVKIEKAERLLKHTAKNINQIADELGYDHASYFISQFKKMNGVTPATYKQLHYDKVSLEVSQNIQQITKISN